MDLNEAAVGVEPREYRAAASVGRASNECQREGAGPTRGVAHALMAYLATRGTPEHEADLLSYLFFDRRFTGRLVEMGREDARARADEVLELFSTRST